MSSLEYLGLYEVYTAIVILFFVAILYKAPEIHHYQVGVTILCSVLPLASFVLAWQDTLGYHVVIIYLTVALPCIIVDYQDFWIAIKGSRPFWKMTRRTDKRTVKCDKE